jgi:hypothetical protein
MKRQENAPSIERRMGDPKDFPPDVFSDRKFKQGPIVAEIDRKIANLKQEGEKK